ncbi:hypothetical protein, partial [Salmonella sp. SAL4444]|uniref:hypothetical protein n=1 Tax=Salmonella sp. SAL4444 TaxID=3159899 RepID=UPI00397BCF17
PLNPAYPAAEFDFHLADLNAQALLVPADSDSPAIAVARARGSPILELVPQATAEAGVFTIAGEGRRRVIEKGPAQPDDTALV